MDFYTTQIKAWLISNFLSHKCLKHFTSNWVHLGKKKTNKKPTCPKFCKPADYKLPSKSLRDQQKSSENQLKAIWHTVRGPITAISNEKTTVWDPLSHSVMPLHELKKKKIFGEETTVCNESKSKHLLALRVQWLMAGDFTRFSITKWQCHSSTGKLFYTCQLARAADTDQRPAQAASLSTDLGLPSGCCCSYVPAPQLLLLGIATLRPGEWWAHPSNN